MYGFVEAFLVIVTTSIFAVTVHLISVQYAVVSGAFITLVLTTVLLFVIIKPSKRKYHDSRMEKFPS
ncbi:hypothetical protein [Salipaludibacillus sp. CF4.18]|uniref:hypothetical protein n=1 Tax=Salipaludibacillus sp. CF4.18 TaxID=3373081 RepID=UPI003EE631B6